MKTTLNSKAGSIFPFRNHRTPMADRDMQPFKLTVFLKRRTVPYRIEVICTPDLFKKAMSSKGSIPNDAKKLKAEIDAYLEKAYEISDMYPNADQRMVSNLF